MGQMPNDLPGLLHLNMQIPQPNMGMMNGGFNPQQLQQMQQQMMMGQGMEGMMGMPQQQRQQQMQQQPMQQQQQFPQRQGEWSSARASSDANGSEQSSISYARWTECRVRSTRGPGQAGRAGCAYPANGQDWADLIGTLRYGKPEYGEPGEYGQHARRTCIPRTRDGHERYADPWSCSKGKRRNLW
jgi:hypothetical protein